MTSVTTSSDRAEDAKAASPESRGYGARLWIGEVARRSGHSVHTLRYYEAEGLMPRVERDSAGRRIYYEKHIGWLEFLDRLRATNMPIRRMKQYTQLVEDGDQTLEQRLELLSAHKRDVEQELRYLQQALDLLQVKIERQERTGKAGCGPPV